MRPSYRARNGASAAITQQVPIPATRAFDLVPGTSVENRSSPPTALHELDERFSADGSSEGLRLDHDGPSFGHTKLRNLICAHGEFHLSSFPSAFDLGYEQLARSARRAAPRSRTPWS